MNEPEFESVETFVQHLMDDERTEFSAAELQKLNATTRTRRGDIRKELEGYGFKLKLRGHVRKVNGFKKNHNDRWFGPGSEPCHGGSGFSNRE